MAVLGTNAPDTLAGGGAGEIVIGFGGADRMRGGGRRPAGVNVYDAGGGSDVVRARNGGPSRCGAGPGATARTWTAGTASAAASSVS